MAFCSVKVYRVFSLFAQSACGAVRSSAVKSAPETSASATAASSVLSRAGGRLFLDVEYGNADANDENNDDADGNGGEAGFRDVDEGTVCLLLHNGVVAELVVEEIDGAQTECAHNEAAQRCKDTRDNGNAFALLRIRGQIRQPRPIRNIHNGIGHAVQYVHHRYIDVHGRGTLLNSQRRK